MATKAFIAEKEDIDFGFGEYIDSKTWTITNSDDSAYDFTVHGGVSDIDFKVYDRAGGTELEASDTNSGLSQATNIITWAYPWASFHANSNLVQNAAYYYELTWTPVDLAEPIRLAYGVVTWK